VIRPVQLTRCSHPAVPILIESSEKFRNKLEFFSVDASEADNAAAMAKVRRAPFAAHVLLSWCVQDSFGNKFPRVFVSVRCTQMQLKLEQLISHALLCLAGGHAGHGRVHVRPVSLRPIFDRQTRSGVREITGARGASNLTLNVSGPQKCGSGDRHCCDGRWGHHVRMQALAHLDRTDVCATGSNSRRSGARGAFLRVRLGHVRVQL